jgi:hypothetical protein
MITRAPEGLMTLQKYDLRYGKKHRAKLLRYHQEYYKRGKRQTEQRRRGFTKQRKV